MKVKEIHRKSKNSRVKESQRESRRGVKESLGEGLKRGESTRVNESH